MGRAEKMTPLASWRPRPSSAARAAAAADPRARRPLDDEALRHAGSTKALSAAAVGAMCGREARLSGRERLTHS